MAFNVGSSFDDDQPMAEINIIPLVDVMLVLLIITMITSPFMEKGVDVDLPIASGQGLRKKSSQNPVTLFVSKNQNIRIGEKPILKSELKAALIKEFKDDKNRELFVRADKSVPYGVVAQVMALVQSAGVEKVGLVTADQ